jgi:formate hydrogenlyase transcriptional activator
MIQGVKDNLIATEKRHRTKEKIMLNITNLKGRADGSPAAGWNRGHQNADKHRFPVANEFEIGRRGIVGASRAIASVFQDIDVVAPTDSTVLIQGETGTGKELFARAIHESSSRRKGPLVTLNCAAIPCGLLESELFGHEKGAFTGAVTQRLGRFEMANQGTIFLDEIGEIALDLQVKLLRVLQEQEFERLGSGRTTRVNVRVVAATNRNLQEMVEAGQFRSHLYYRLNVFPISLPPLRDRREDIQLLVRHFIATYSERMNKFIEEIPAEIMGAMVSYDWPGNIRQLQHFVEQGVIISDGPVFLPRISQLRRANIALVPRDTNTLEDATRSHIVEILKATNWVVGGKHGAAARLGLARTTLLSKMRRLGIESGSADMRGGEARRQAAFA